MPDLNMPWAWPVLLAYNFAELTYSRMFFPLVGFLAFGAWIWIDDGALHRRVRNWFSRERR